MHHDIDPWALLPIDNDFRLFGILNLLQRLWDRALLQGFCLLSSFAQHDCCLQYIYYHYFIMPLFPAEKSLDSLQIIAVCMMSQPLKL